MRLPLSFSLLPEIFRGCLEFGGKGGNSMGLILEARSYHYSICHLGCLHSALFGFLLEDQGTEMTRDVSFGGIWGIHESSSDDISIS